MAGNPVTPKTAGLSDGNYALIGKLATPLKMYVLQQSREASKRDGAYKWICNMDTSNRFAESAVAMERPAGLVMTDDGANFEQFDRSETDYTTIYHHQYARYETITASTVEDSMGGVTAEMRRQMRLLTDDYYITKNQLAAIMVTSGTKTEYTFANGKKLFLPAPAGKPLYYKSHPIGSSGDTQSNLFYTTRSSGVGIDYSVVEAMMQEATVRLRNMTTNDGTAAGYTANYMIIPGNNGALERACKKAIGSELSDRASVASNGINIQHGNWGLIILTDWRVPDGRCPIAFMSTMARDRLGGFMMYDRVSLKISDSVNHRNGNYEWTARARLGIGSFTYLHTLMYESLANGTTTLYDGQTAADAATEITL